MKRQVKILILTAGVFIALSGIHKTVRKDRIYINEVRSTAVSANRDSHFGSDYIEFYNGGVEEGNTLNFKVSAKGEKVFLSNPDGVLIDSVYVPELGYGQSGIRFIGLLWSGKKGSDTIEAEVLPGGITLEAVFEKTAQ